MYSIADVKYSKALLYAASDAVIDGVVVKSRGDIISNETQDKLYKDIFNEISHKSYEDVILVQTGNCVQLFLPKKDTDSKRLIFRIIERTIYLQELIKIGKILIHEIEE